MQGILHRLSDNWAQHVYHRCRRFCHRRVFQLFCFTSKNGGRSAPCIIKSGFGRLAGGVGRRGIPRVFCGVIGHGSHNIGVGQGRSRPVEVGSRVFWGFTTVSSICRGSGYGRNRRSISHLYLYVYDSSYCLSHNIPDISDDANEVSTEAVAVELEDQVACRRVRWIQHGMRLARRYMY